MRKLTTSLLLGVCVVLLGAGCAMVQTPLVGVIYSNVDAGTAATSNAGWSKMGTASSQVILGFAMGDASIETAAKSAGITKIHHVDHHVDYILGVYAKYTVKVYGD